MVGTGVGGVTGGPAVGRITDGGSATGKEVGATLGEAVSR